LEDAVTTETAFTGQQALEALLPLGFAVDRTTDRIFVSRGAMKFTLPKGEELCSQQLNKVIHSVVEDLKERAINAGRARRDNKVPLMVTYRDNVFAVVEDRHTKWQLHDLDDGHRFEALKIHCRPYEPEPAAPKFTVHDIPPVSAPAPEPIPQTPPSAPISIPLSPLLTTGNATDWTALVRLAQRRVEGVKIEYEQLMNRANQLREQYETGVAFIRSLGVEIPDIGEPVPGLGEPPKRTILPPTHGPGHNPGRQAADNSRWVDRLHMAWIDAGKPSGYGYLQKIKDKVNTMGEQLPPDATLYKLMKDVYAKAAGG
jgi:hypothetical protein